MVSHTRTSSRPVHLRAVNEPRPIRIQAENGFPAALIVNRRHQQITSIQDTWIIEDEWWRDPINRQYFALVLEDGAFLTVFRDRITDAWFAQTY